MLSYHVFGLLCLFSMNVGWIHGWSNENQQTVSHLRSCDFVHGKVCIPTACSKQVCSLFKTAVCVNDRCGCEARFFNWMSEEKTYQDVSKMCLSSNFVSNFLNFTIAKDNSTHNDEDSATVLQFFKEFNLLVTEVMKDVADYVKIVTETSPTRANIERLKFVIRSLSSLKRSARDLADAEKIEGRSIFKTIAKGILTIGGEILNNFDETSDLPSEDRQVLKKTGKNYKTDVAILRDVLDGQGVLADVVESGNVAISDKTAQSKLKAILNDVDQAGY